MIQIGDKKIGKTKSLLLLQKCQEIIINHWNEH